MAISIVGTATGVDTASATVDTITLPAGIQAGDGLLLFFGYASGAITTTLTDNGLSVPLTQVGATATFSGHQSQVWVAQNLAAADSGKVITFTQSTGVRELRCRVPGRVEDGDGQRVRVEDVHGGDDDSDDPGCGDHDCGVR
jgi:hypothetical protein